MDLLPISFLIIPVVASFLLANMDKQARKAEIGMDNNNFIVHQPKFVFWLGIICALSFAVMFIIVITFTNEKAEWFGWVSFS